MNEHAVRIDCKQFEEALPDLDRPGTEGSLLREAALAHAELCGNCAELLTESESLDFSLRSLAAHDGNCVAPPRVEAALLNRFRQDKGIASRRKVQWQLSVLGAAAAALLAVGLSLHRGSVKAVPVAETAEASGANAFTPLPYADDPDSFDGGAVVRVVLSSSALASMGVPVTEIPDADRISADLVVSADGTPQAIRLVSQSTRDQAR
jgi:hypothetical protein